MALVSVIIPCYNQGQYLTESIGSVLASDHQKIEIIVVDDGSTDPETCRILGGLDYPKTRLIRRENGGLAAARNSGIAAAQGRYILPLDADDRIGPTISVWRRQLWRVVRIWGSFTAGRRSLGKRPAPGSWPPFPVGVWRWVT